MRARLRFSWRWLAWAWWLALALAAGWAQFGPAAGPVAVDVERLSQPPSAAHWLGTDLYGRDILVDLLLGTRQVFAVSLPAALLASALGVGLGAAAGYWGNSGLRIRRSAVLAALIGLSGWLLTPPDVGHWWLLAVGLTVALVYAQRRFAATLALPLDWLMQSAAAALGSIPRLVLVLALAAFHAPSNAWLVAVLALTCWPTTARLTRTLVQQVRSQTYVEAGQVAGYSAVRLLRGHIGPNIWPGLRPTLPLNFSICLGLQTTLAFLGIGLPPDQADWGLTLAHARVEAGAGWATGSALLVLTLTIITAYQLLPKPARDKTAKASIPVTKPSFIVSPSIGNEIGH